MTEQAMPTTSESTPASPDTTASATPAEPTARERATRIGLAAIVALAIVAAAWFVGEQQGWSEIGDGGINASLLPKVGEPAPELFTMSTEGQPVLLSQLRGEPVWINFWGSWCYPCRAEMPEIQRAYETLAPQGVNVLSISMREDPAEAVRYRDSVGATFPVYIEPARISSVIDAAEQPELARQMAAMTNEWQIANFPTHVFIDRDGIVQNIVLAQMTYDEAVGFGNEILGESQALMQPAVVREIA